MAVAALAALALAADYGTIRLSPSLEMAITSLVFVFAAVFGLFERALR